MKLYTESEYQNAAQKTLLNLECDACHKVFQRTKKNIYHSIISGSQSDICSRLCDTKRKTTAQEYSCEVCDSKFTRPICQVKKSKHLFCSRSCAAIYSNAHAPKISSNCIKCGADILLYSKNMGKKICSGCRKLRKVRKAAQYNAKIRKCNICGKSECERKEICKSPQLFKGLNKYFGFDLTTLGSVDAYREFDRVSLMLREDYWDRKLSLQQICDKYNHNNVGNLSKLLTCLGIGFRNLSQSHNNALISGRQTPPSCLRYKHGFHTTWNNKRVFYRSSYELELAKIFDEQKIDYEVEGLRIVYWDSQKLMNRVAIPDFYLPAYNKIIEVKSKYTLDYQNMIDKRQEYLKHGYSFELWYEKEYINLEDLQPERLELSKPKWATD